MTKEQIVVHANDLLRQSRKLAGEHGDIFVDDVLVLETLIRCFEENYSNR